MLQSFLMFIIGFSLVTCVIYLLDWIKEVPFSQFMANYTILMAVIGLLAIICTFLL